MRESDTLYFAIKKDSILSPKIKRVSQLQETKSKVSIRFILS